MSSRKKKLFSTEDDNSQSSSDNNRKTSPEFSQESSLSSSSSQMDVDYSPRFSGQVTSSSEDENFGKTSTRNKRQENKKPIAKSTPKKLPKNRRRDSTEIDDSQTLDNETSIYSAIKKNISSKCIVEKWIEKYKISKANGILILMQFFIDSSGFKKIITPEMLATLLNSAIVNRVAQDIDNSDEKYPLIKPGAEWKQFRDKLCQFIKVLIEQCHQNEILYDSELIRNTVPFLTELTKSEVRDLRHTSTLIGITIITSLVDILAQLTEDSSNEEDNASSSTEENSLEEKKKRIINILTPMIKDIFIMRFKDICGEIRAICIQGIGLWMKNYPELFLKDNFLEYIGIMLHDTDGDVRLKCLEVLQPLYASEILQNKLVNFTQRFKNRLVSMTLDIKDIVAVEAVKTMIEIFEHHSDIIINDCEKIYHLVFESYQPLARLAGKFAKMRFLVSQEPDLENRSLGGKLRSPNTNLIKILLLFFVESNVPDTDLFVDSFFDDSEFMKDWECMTDLLLEEAGPNEEAINDQMETAMIKIMASCVKQAATGNIPESRGVKSKMSTKERQKIKEDKQKITKHFMQTLPPLISKYRENSGNLANLLLIPQYFDLNLHSRLGEEADLDSLLIEIQTVIKTAQDDESLKNAIKTLCFFCTEGHQNYTKCDTVCSRLIDVIVQTYKINLEQFVTDIESDQESDEYLANLTQSLKQIGFFYMKYNLNPWKIWDSLINHIADRLLTTSESTKIISDEGIKYCIMSCYMSIMRDYQEILEWAETESSDDSDSRNQEHCLRLREHLNKYMELMCNLINEENVHKPVAFTLNEDAYTTFCDLLLIFSNRLTFHSNPLIHQLVYESNETTRSMINNFLEEFVFSEESEENMDESKEVEYLNKKRKFFGSYCKLIIHNIIPIKHAAYLFKYYGKFSKDYGDLFKDTFIGAMAVSRINCALTMQYSLNLLFEEMLVKKGRIDRHSKEFAAMKDLAKKFALSFGTDYEKNKEALTSLLRVGILFSFKQSEDVISDYTVPPQNLAFLEILSEFNGKILKEDKDSLLEFLEEQTPFEIDSLRGQEWLPLVSYKKNVLQDDGNKFKKPRKPKNAGRSRKSQLEIIKTSLPRRVSSSIFSPREERNLNADTFSPLSPMEDSPSPIMTQNRSYENLENSEGSFTMEVSPIDDLD